MRKKILDIPSNTLTKSREVENIQNNILNFAALDIHSVERF